MTMKAFLFYLIQFTWGLPQNLVGLIAYLILKRSCKTEKYHRSVITYVDKKNFGGLSLGCFIFIGASRKDDWLHDTKIHEYGHTIQSLVLGPVWPFVIALPSVIWCNTPKFVRMRKEKGVSYYWLYCEGWANLWGRAATKESFVSENFIKTGAFGKPVKPARFELANKK